MNGGHIATNVCKTIPSATRMRSITIINTVEVAWMELVRVGSLMKRITELDITGILGRLISRSTTLVCDRIVHDIPDLIVTSEKLWVVRKE